MASKKGTWIWKIKNAMIWLLLQFEEYFVISLGNEFDGIKSHGNIFSNFH